MEPLVTTLTTTCQDGAHRSTIAILEAVPMLVRLCRGGRSAASFCRTPKRSATVIAKGVAEMTDHASVGGPFRLRGGRSPSLTVKGA
jgi:hypothetical protein